MDDNRGETAQVTFQGMYESVDAHPRNQWDFAEDEGDWTEGE